MSLLPSPIPTLTRARRRRFILHLPIPLGHRVINSSATQAPSKSAHGPRSEAGFLSSRPFVFVHTDPSTVLSISLLYPLPSRPTFLDWDPLLPVVRRTAGGVMRTRSTDKRCLILTISSRRDLLITLAYINAVYSPLQEARSVPRQPEVYSSGV
ncbi:hypothetical protein R3P38DRAFT_2800142 [Favolaschia claudopus]|uniref:Uncharacterized protein n=1 Tax=Favolaschia claudopus TaxID=2862362 RepID=A0AAV9ZY88_9AGAR